MMAATKEELELNLFLLKQTDFTFLLFLPLNHKLQGLPKRPDTFENLIEIKRVDENN